MRQILSPEDLKRGELVEPGWYPVEIVEYKEEEAKTDGSTNSIFYLKVIDGKNKGASLMVRFNEKALGFGKQMFASLGVPKDATGGYELSTELFQQFVGRQLKVYVARGKSNKGNEFNDVKDYQPIG
jgi:hypothetical protein